MDCPRRRHAASAGIEIGRFLQPDPKEFEAGDYNLYRYCHNEVTRAIRQGCSLAGQGQV
jgi:hypothetical protein